MKVVGFGDVPNGAEETAAKPARRRRLDREVFGSHMTLGELEHQLYGHVLDAIDFGALGGLEQHLYGLLCDMELDDDLALDLSKLVISRALERAVEDNARYCNFGAPDGVPEAEAKAVAFEESCPFCVLDAEEAKYLAEHPPGEEHGESCACCEDMVRMWRDQHADTLRKHGLYPADGRPGTGMGQQGHHGQNPAGTDPELS